jgi:hypothetical protein
MILRNAVLTCFVILALIAIFLTASLSGVTQNLPTYKPTGAEANLVGTISFTGVPHNPRRIDVSADPICATVNPESTQVRTAEELEISIPTEDVVVTDGKLANVFVYAQTGDPLDAYSFDVPFTEVTLEHKGCQYQPRVLGLQTRQVLKIVNSDPTTHNTHPIPKNNPEWNRTQPLGDNPIEYKFALAELLIPMKDNQHPWEKAYIGVLSHPFFAVSGRDGSYKIAGLPPGQYTFAAWHEKYGEQTVTVSVGSKEQQTLDFTFKAPDK